MSGAGTGGSVGASAAPRSCSSCARGLRPPRPAARVPPAATRRRRVIRIMTDLLDVSETPEQRNEAANPQWGGRFAAGPSVVMQEINASIGFDRRLWRQDITGSLAHAAMLAKVGVIAAQDEQAIRSGLAAIAHEIETGRFPFDAAVQ